MSKTSKATAQQPPPLPQSIVVGLNAWNAKSKISNANFECHLNEQVTVNNGDSIFVKASYLDTRGTASNNIVLTKDTEISLEYYFYWIHTFNACDPTGITTFSADKTTELTQQVLVGQTIPQLFAANKLLSPNIPQVLPAYLTANNTGINDADGLPYLVYQSADNVPVPAVFGETALARTILSDRDYVINKAGLTTNWALAGVVNATSNQLPPNWVLNVEYFTSAFNPDVNISPLFFLIFGYVNITPLPYVKYIITELGNTDWEAIDPTILGSPVSANYIENGLTYTIDEPGNLDWTVWGAADNNHLTTFVADLTFNPAPPSFPITLSNHFFQSNTQYYNNIGKPAFTATDYFEVGFNMDVLGNYTIVTLAGSGNWLSQNVGGGYNHWTLPPFSFGIGNFAPSATNLTIGNINAYASSGGVQFLNPNNSYTINNYGSVTDGSSPPFHWGLVGTFPTATTATMVVGTSYQVTVNNCFNPTAPPFGGVVGDFFTASTTSLSIPTQYDVAYGDVLNHWIFYNSAGVKITTGSLSTHSLHLAPDVLNHPAWNTGVGQIDFTGTPLTPYLGQTIYIKIYDPNKTYQPVNWLFSSNNFTANSITFATITTQIPSQNFPFTLYWATPSLLIELNPAVTNTFIATGAYLGNTSASVLPTYRILTATLSGNGFLNGSMYNGAKATVGTIIKALNQDPAYPNDSGGRASVAPYQYESTVPYEYSGTIQPYTPATVTTVIKPVKKKWKMTLKAGSYDPNNLSQIISRSMSRQRTKRVNNIQGAPFGTQSAINIPTDNVWNTIPNGDIWAEPTGLGSNTFYDSKNLQSYTNPPNPDYNIDPDNDDMPFLFVPAMNGTPLHGSSPDNANDYLYAQIPHPNMNNLNGIHGNNYFVNLVPLLSDVRSVSPTIPATVAADGYYSILPFYSQNTITQSTPDTGVSGIFPVAFGATQTSLLYNNENNSLFSFNYLHSPLLAFLSSTASDLTEATAHLYTTKSKSTNMLGTTLLTTQVDKKSGILLNQMNPPEFWTQLGFDIPSLTVDLDDPQKVGFQMTLDDFNQRTTGGFSGSSNIFNQTYHTKGSSEQPSVPDTELIYLSVVPPTNPPANPLNAFVGALTIGSSYKITQAGNLQENQPPFETYTNDNWSYIGGPDVTGQGSTVVGAVFTAIATGFPLNGNGIDNSSWVSNVPPQVVLANTPAFTASQLQNTYYQVTNTNTLNAISIPLSQDAAGHYLLEITGYNSIFLDDKSKREIKSIVSSYYVNAGSFTSQPFPDSYNFFNYGAPITLSNIKVRILDPITREEVIGLGGNSSVYLQINKLLTQEAVAQVEN